MCSIFGMYRYHSNAPARVTSDAVHRAFVRGRDSWGVVSPVGAVRSLDTDEATWRTLEGVVGEHWVIGNTRAEPTTEWVRDKTAESAQPFRAGALTVAHNGTFANDVALCERYGVPTSIPGEAHSEVDTARWARVAAHVVYAPEDVLRLLGESVGSYGIAVGHEDGWLVLAANYKPIWTRFVHGAIEFTSVAPDGESFLERLHNGWTMLPPYSALILRPHREPEWVNLREPVEERALVVCSGGLDSTVAATMSARDRLTDLLHITYGCRAQAREVESVRHVAEYLGVRLHHVDLTDVFRVIGNSRLTGTWEGAETGNGGADGAEYAHEWVPARNLILLAVAAGVAEAHGYTHLVLGNNIEEAGAYPDNDPEFISRLNAVLPHAVGDGKSVTIEQPVGGMTKREIVAAGIAHGAPLALTWSCYDGGTRHCGTCGPCYMRRTAFAMAGTPDPMAYADGGA